eukprot:TRINITY_DN1904_c0_g2_i1.p1 TRINITY_DN1904_c0_g2~~TRINITY_DN1904_c0_g2_i1.p1  ORF type:complete len:158 (-),score=52.18 TRINITY_DN1904_c0_g2_i1:1297-1770(-)
MWCSGGEGRKVETITLRKKYARKIAFWTQIPEENGEAFYLIRYNKGQEYQAHLDWFRSDETGQKELKEFGDRVATVLLYLSTPSEGGETEFPNIDLSVPAKKGNAVLFWDYAPNFEGDHSTLHAGKPVISGTKWCMTKEAVVSTQSTFFFFFFFFFW